MNIGKNKLRKIYGIDLPPGLYNISNNGEYYTVNTVKDDTEGCILVGKELRKNMLLKSREAFADLFERIKVALNLNESITIEIKNADAENGLLYGAGEQSYGEAIQCSKTD